MDNESRGFAFRNEDHEEIKLLYARARVQFAWNEEDLCAPFWRYYWNPSGKGSLIQTGKKEVGIKPEMAILISRDTHYIPHCKAPLDHLFFHFNITGTEGYPNRIEPNIYQWTLEKQEINRLEELYEALLSVSVFSFEMFHRIKSLIHSGLAGLPWLQSTAQRDPRVVKALRFLQEHFSHDTSLDEIAEASDTSVSTLTRIFRKETGSSVQGYIIKKRCDLAAILLTGTDLPIDEIAYRCGYPDRHYFSRIFSRQRGLPPATFRRRME